MGDPTDHYGQPMPLGARVRFWERPGTSQGTVTAHCKVNVEVNWDARARMAKRRYTRVAPHMLAVVTSGQERLAEAEQRLRVFSEGPPDITDGLAGAAATMLAEVERLRAEVRDLTAARDRVLAECDAAEKAPGVSTVRITAVVEAFRAALAVPASDTEPREGR